MAKNNFKNCLAETLKWEGGWADHPKDPGGATMRGITLATFRRWKPNATKTELRNITDAMLEKIYKADYWAPVKGDTLAEGVDLATFDYAVNSGPGTARKALLAVIGGSDVQTVQKLCARRLSSYKTFKTWATFGKGWTNRITTIEAKGVAWALAAQGNVKAGLEKEVKKAEDKAAAQASGGVAGGSGGAVAPVATDGNWIAWVVLGVLAVGAIWLIYRASVNRKRAAAYKAEMQ